MDCDFKGIILQPISRNKSPWEGYDNNMDFLNFFQTTFKENIEEKFCVNHNTIEFSDYLLVPYLNKKCFGAYYIKYGDKIDDENYSYAYFINYEKSYKFIKEEHIDTILDSLVFYRGLYKHIAHDNRTIFYELYHLPHDFKKNICKNFKDLI